MTGTKTFTVNNLTFDCYVSGNESDPLVLLLHGFPETAHMWLSLMDELADAGFYCVAPNQRGYSKGARPRGKKHYTLSKLSADVLGMVQALGREQFHLIGHDWGAAIGWKVVHDHPAKILSWTGLSVPHLQAFFGAVAKDKDQRQRSRYMSAFQFPLLPEMNIRKNDFRIFRRLWKYSSKIEVENYLSVFRDKKTLTAALNYYRANGGLVKRAMQSQIIGDITVPTLFIWGENDKAIGPVSVENGHKYMKGYYKFLPLEAGHWLIQTKYEEIHVAVKEHLLKF
jgi:pimeloyl-ACP methyl ester carboxylesterase